jgi:hypothetical protein
MTAPTSPQTPPTSLQWPVVAASVTGAAHLRSSTPCDDAFAVARLQDGALAVAVADGAGSAPMGGRGAAVAVQATLHALTDPHLAVLDWDQRVEWVLRWVEGELAVTAGCLGVPVSDLASTLSFAVAGHDSVKWAQIGDGAIVALTDGDSVLLGRPQRGMFAGETVFVGPVSVLPDTGELAGEWLGLALLTDGVAPIALERDDRPSPGFFEPVCRHAGGDDPATGATQLASWLEGVRDARDLDDDLTLVAVAGRAS